jgi:hypothetical protein
MTNAMSRGKMLWHTFQENLKIFQRGPVVGGRNRPIIWGVTHQGVLVDGMTLEGFLSQAGRVLCDSRRVYCFENSLVYEFREGEIQRLVLLASPCRAEPSATSILANLFAVGIRSTEASKQSLVPGKLVNTLLVDEDLRKRLPTIRFYSRRPIFDATFKLCRPGWNADQGILMHGPDLAPTLPPPELATRPKTLDRIPPFTRRLLQDFCWASDADLTNALALLLTGLLINHFVDEPHPIGIIDGNQRGLGKTLFCQAIGRVLDNVEPPRIPLVRDDELEKKLCAQLREPSASLFFFDNVRNRIESAVIEQNALSPLLSFRILGQSGTLKRPNTFLWLVTSNMTSGTEDFINRGLPIRLRYEGNPRERNFAENLLEYASTRRLDILGELAGMVLRWKEAGRPKGTSAHRCRRWAEVIGGILRVCGLTDFLGNIEEAEASMDEGLIALASLAEYVVNHDRTMFLTPPGRKPQDWVELCREADVFRDKLASLNSLRGRTTYLGQFLSAKVGRRAEINTAAGIQTVSLQVHEARAKQKFYYFEVESVPESPGEDEARASVVGDGGGDPGLTNRSNEPAPTPQTVSAVARRSGEALQPCTVAQPNLQQPCSVAQPNPPTPANRPAPAVSATAEGLGAAAERANDLEWY